MLSYVFDDQGKLRVEQWTVAPAVYLDHWALRGISEDVSLRQRFLDALLGRAGTLMLSWLNLVEFTRVTDTTQARAAEELLEGILPNVFFLEVNPFAVIETEDRLLAGAQPAAPHADTSFLRAFVGLKPHSIRLFTARHLFTIAQDSGLSSQFLALADVVVERVEALRTSFTSDRAFKARVKRLPRGPDIQRGTRYILRELVRPMLLDRASKVTRNNAIDLVHAVVPAAYCDLMLLDRHWKTQIERMVVRFQRTGMAFPVATAFCGKRNGLEGFFSALESAA